MQSLCITSNLVDGADSTFYESKSIYVSVGLRCSLANATNILNQTVPAIHIINYKDLELFTDSAGNATSQMSV
jgi:hypothetical protein